MALTIRMFAGLEITGERGGPIEIPGRKPRALLALLARHAGQPQDREALAVRLWPDAGPSQARASLRQALKTLRRALGTDKQVVLSKRDAVVLDASVETDVAAFEQSGAEDRAATRVTDLYLGDFLEGFVAPTEALEEWIAFERSALRETALRALARLVEATTGSQADRSETAAAVRMALRLLALDPLQESVHRHLMRLYLVQGRRSDAVAQYRLCRNILERELGVAPDPETEALFGRLLVPSASPASPVERPAVAVPMFRTLGGEGEPDYFSEGLTEDIIAALTRWRSFPVVAGHAPGARYLLEGSVRRQDLRVRIAVRLSDNHTGVQRWAARYERELVDLFEIQDEITLRVASTVAPELSRAELERGQAKRPEDLGAWDYVLQGMAKMRDRTVSSHREARSLFGKALAIRADYAEAHAGVAMSYNVNIVVGGETDRVAAARKALNAARRAVYLDPASAVAHQELSTAYQLLGRTEEALAEIRIAVELNPYDAVGLHQLGNKSDLAGDPRGIGYMEQAHRLNPLEMQLQTRLAFLARAYLNAGEFARAEETARRSIRLNGHYPQSHYLLALALGHLGRIAEGRAELARCEALEPRFVAERRVWAPYRDAANNARLRSALLRLEGNSQDL